MVTNAGRSPDAESTVVGVIGSPIVQSLSPLLHNTAFGALGLNWVSVAFEVADGEAGGAMAAMRVLRIAGLSVTMPHKLAVASLVDESSAAAQRLNSVNCVINRSGTLRGENTDGAGFVAALLRAAGFDPLAKRCVVVGAGGAARAVIDALAAAGAAEVAVVNRTVARAHEAAALAGARGRAIEAATEAEVAPADLVVNATPMGMSGVGPAPGHGDPDWLVDPTWTHSGQVVADLIYAPRPTAWLRATSATGATTVDGLGMLVHQAAEQIALWTGLAAPLDAMWQAATAARPARNVP